MKDRLLPFLITLSHGVQQLELMRGRVTLNFKCNLGALMGTLKKSSWKKNGKFLYILPNMVKASFCVNS